MLSGILTQIGSFEKDITSVPLLQRDKRKEDSWC